MKPLKSATQKNVTVDTDYYNMYDLAELSKIDGIEYLFNRFVVFTKFVKDLKVVCDRGYYRTVAVMNSGETVYVNI